MQKKSSKPSLSKLSGLPKEKEEKEDFNKSVEDGNEPERAMDLKKKSVSGGVCWQTEVWSGGEGQNL